MIAFELFLFLIILAASIYVVSAFLLRHSKRNDPLKKKVRTLFCDNNTHKQKE